MAKSYNTEVVAIKNYFDIKLGRRVLKGETSIVKSDRAEYLISLGLVSYTNAGIEVIVEAPKAEKKVKVKKTK